MKVTDIRGERVLRVADGGTETPGSVFVMGGAGFCIEIDRQEFLAAIERKFDLAPASRSSTAIQRIVALAA